MSMAFLCSALTVLVDMKFSYWSYRGMAYWNQMRIVIDSFTLITGFFVFMNYYENIAREQREMAGECEEDEENEEIDHDKRD